MQTQESEKVSWPGQTQVSTKTKAITSLLKQNAILTLTLNSLNVRIQPSILISSCLVIFIYFNADSSANIGVGNPKVETRHICNSLIPKFSRWSTTHPSAAHSETYRQQMNRNFPFCSLRATQAECKEMEYVSVQKSYKLFSRNNIRSTISNFFPEFAQKVVRRYIFHSWHTLMLDALAQSSHKDQ